MSNPEKLLDQAIMAMENGEVASGVIIALVRYKAGKPYLESEKNIYVSALEFLKRVKDGYNWWDQAFNLKKTLFHSRQLRVTGRTVSQAQTSLKTLTR